MRTSTLKCVNNMKLSKIVNSKVMRNRSIVACGCKRQKRMVAAAAFGKQSPKEKKEVRDTKHIIWNMMIECVFEFPFVTLFFL